MGIIENYSEQLALTRQYRDDGEVTKRLLNTERDHAELHLFWLYYCGLGVKMTEPVESWIKRAGQGIAKIGFTGFGKRLEKHSKEEANHQLMFMRDTNDLVDHWNILHPEKRLQAEEFLNHDYTECVRRYVAIHEENIDGSTPYGQLAIQYEIEQLSITIIPRLLEHAKTYGDETIYQSLSFLRHHYKLDIKHTEENDSLVSDFLAQCPNAFDVLVEVGKESLEIYMGFFEECLDLAEKRYRFMFT